MADVAVKPSPAVLLTLAPNGYYLGSRDGYPHKYGPGEQVAIPRADVARCLRSGAFLDPRVPTTEL